MVVSEAKKYCLVFPEGKGILGGWALLAEKLRSPRVLTHDEPKGVFDFFRTESRVGAPEGKAKNSYVDTVKSRVRRLGKAVWLQLGEKDVLSGRELLDRCLVGRWGESPLPAPNLFALGSWGRSHWNPKRGVKFVRLGSPFIKIEFENKAEVEKVLLRRLHCFKETFLYLERWNPKVGCFQNCEQVKEAWVRVVGLPLHFWSREVFRKIREGCGGFVTVDEDIVAFKELQWARILVKSKGLEWPTSLQVVVGSSCFSIQLWWEVQPRVSKVAPMFRSGMGKEQEVRDDGGGGSRTDCNVEQVQTQWQSAKVVVSCEVEEACRKKDKEATTFDFVSARGAEDEGVKGRVSSDWEEVSTEGPLA